MNGIEMLNSVAFQWSTFMWHRLVDSTWVLLIAVIIWSLVRHRVSAQFGYCLFLLVLLKLVIPIQAPLPDKAARVFSAPLTPAVPQVTRPLESTPATASVAKQRRPDKTPELTTPERDVTQAETHQSRRMPLSTPALLMIGWLSVLIGLLLRFAYTEWHTLRLIARSCPVGLETMGISSNDIKTMGNLTQPIRALANPNVTSPCVYGLFSPVLLVPVNLTDRYTADEIRWMLLHELAHIRRRDTLVKVFQKFIQCVFFFHPAVWIANGMIDRQREFACDDIAVRQSHLSRTDCGEHFFNIITKLNQPRGSMPGVLGLLSPYAVIRKRLMRMLNQNHTHQIQLSTSALVCLAMVALLVLPFSSTASSTAALTESMNAVEAIEPGSVTFPANDYIQQDNRTLWKQSASANAETIAIVHCVSQDGDLQVKSHVDADKNTVDVEAHITIAPNSNVEITPELEQAILALKENVGVVVKRIDPQQPGEENTITVQTVIPEQKPKGLSVSIDMDIILPARLALTVRSQDGDIHIQGPIGATSLVTMDGDIAVSDCRGALSIKSEDGDLAVNNCGGSLTIEAQDGDISANACGDAVAIRSQDGDVSLNECTGPLTLELEDGDVMVQNCREAVSVKAEDGDILLRDVSADINVSTEDGDILIETDIPLQNDCLLQSSDGDILLRLPETSDLTLDLNTDEGDILLNSPRFVGSKTEHSVRGKLNNGGPALKARSSDGDLAIQFK